MKREITDDITPLSGCHMIEGQGHPDPLVMVIGETPGEDEVRSGVPFGDRAGTLMRGELALSGIDPHAIYYTKAVKCHPHKGRKPTGDEIAAWTDDLVAEVALHQPLHVILAGKVAEVAWALAEARRASNVMAVHRIPHPSAVLRDRKRLGPWQDALRRIGKVVNGEEVEEIVLQEPDPWEEGEPDYDARWLAADTEFRLLNDGGSDDALVCIQVSDGLRAQLYRFDDIARVRERLRGTHVYAHNIKADARNLGIAQPSMPG